MRLSEGDAGDGRTSGAQPTSRGGASLHRQQADRVRVDWVFFNIFLQPMRYKLTGNFRAMLEGQVQSFQRSALGDATRANGAVPWGVGAFGVHHLDAEAMGPRVQLSARQWEEVETEFVHEMAEAVASGTFPRLKAFVYYDAHRSIISNKSASTRATYKDYLGLPSFKVNDNGLRAPGCPELCRATYP